MAKDSVLTNSTEQRGYAMYSQYRQNYVPSQPLPRWIQRLIAWL
jgi:hypothetical protein